MPADRPSRVGGNPAVACRGFGVIRQYRRDSRVSGNDGGAGGKDGKPGRDSRLLGKDGRGDGNDGRKAAERTVGQIEKPARRPIDISPIMLYSGLATFGCRHLARWCSWLTYRPVKAEIGGSSPLRVATLIKNPGSRWFSGYPDWILVGFSARPSTSSG